MGDDLTQYGGSPITGENCADRAQLLLETEVGPEAFAFGAAVLMPVMVDEITRLRARVAELEGALSEIANHGTSQPAALNMPEGPEPDRLKIDQPWQDAMKKALGKKRPPEGWPKN